MPPIKIYKFGGASVRSAEGVENLARIVAAEPARLLVIVSAMGKTTNALEEVLDRFMRNRSDEAIELFAEIERYHRQIVPLTVRPIPLPSRHAPKNSPRRFGNCFAAKPAGRITIAGTT